MYIIMKKKHRLDVKFILIIIQQQGVLCGGMKTREIVAGVESYAGITCSA